MWDAGLGGQVVLQEHWYTAQRSVGKGLAGLRASLLESRRDQESEDAVRALDAFDGSVDDLGGGDVGALQVLGVRDAVEIF